MPLSSNKLSKFWKELKRRKVLYFLIGYLAVCLAIFEFFAITEDKFTLPENTFNLLYILAAVGLPLVIIFPWFINRKKSEAVSDDLGAIQSNAKLDKSIIVLPFENISQDPDQDYFSDGLTEEIITDLSHIHDFLVISRSSAMTFKGSNKKIKDIANEVNVKYVLEGSVRKSENNLKITGQLIDAESDTHIWAEKYNGTLEDIFDIQEKVSRSIADALKIKLSANEKEKINQRPIDNVFAYDCYKRAYPEINSMSKERLDYGLNLLQKGLEIAGDNSVIYAGIATAYFMYANLGFELDKNITKAEEFVKKALDLEPDSAEAHIVCGGIDILKDGDMISAIDHWARAHVLKPEDPETMIYLSLGYDLIGQNDAGKSLADKCARIDPINPLAEAIKSWNHFFGGRFEKALELALLAYKLSPESPMHQFFKAIILVYNDRADEAYDFMCEFVEESSKNIFSQVTIFLKYIILRDKGKLTSLLTSEFVKQIQNDLQHSYHIATFYSYAGEKEEALKWLENAINRGFINYPLLSEHDKLLNTIRDDEGFKLLMKRVKYEWENFEI